MLVFTAEEIRALIRILREHETQVREEEQFQHPVLPHIEKVRNTDLSFCSDELEELEELLKVYGAELRRELDRPLRRDHRETLLHRQQLVNHMLEKVTEACAMV